MKKIRTKIILIFLGITLLPLFPMVWLVNNLVFQSYQVGVNPEVEKALKRGVDYSRELYQIRKIHLSETLSSLFEPSKLSRFLKQPGSPGTLELPVDNKEWHFLAFQFYNAKGTLLAQILGKDIKESVVEPGQLSRVEETSGEKIVLVNRADNRFIAIEKGNIDGLDVYLALTASINGSFLEDTNKNLQVHQLYQTLALSPVSIPRSFLYTFMLISVIILLITVAIAVWLSKKITQPLGRLVTGTHQLGLGNLDYRIELRSRDEIGELVQHFNRMAGELKAFQEKTIYLEKMAAWQEIARRLAHEIKNPLTPIQLTMQEMVDQYPGDDVNYSNLLQECHGIINEEIENLRRLVREFSAFGRLPELHLSEGDLHSLIADVCLLYPHRDIQLQLTEAMPPLQLDEDRMRRVFINLIENACQADPANNPIIINTQIKDSLVEISVKDSGSGIAPAQLEKIFEPYFSTKTNGMGLGLAITRKMVEEHRGTIQVESTPGQGSKFIITLPLTWCNRH